MKKIVLISITLAVLVFVCPAYAAQTDNISLLTKRGFFDTSAQTSFLNPCEEIKKTLGLHLKYSNSYDLNGLKNLYADNYINADGLNKEVYFDLVKKTWASYPDIKYSMVIKNIEINDNIAVVQVRENAFATTNSKSGMVDTKGILENTSDSVYYLENINNKWLVTSDYIMYEKTFLGYGDAKTIKVNLTAPCQILANTQYTSSLKIEAPKNNLIIASVGREYITYPQTAAEEVFRKLPEDGILERIFTANDKNLNEYAVASFGVTKAEINKGTEIKIYITGLGFIMSRVNVIPKNNSVKVAKNEKTE